MGDNINVYASDPGLEVLLGQGSVLNAVSTLRASPRFTEGLHTLGAVGAVVNDQGLPGLPVLLENGASDLMGKYGPFDVRLGNGAASGYEGNLAAICDGLNARRFVLVPVDQAIKDKTSSDVTAVDLSVTVARGAKAFTVEESDDTFSCTSHGMAAGDTFQLVTLTGGTGAVIATTYYVIASGLTANAFKASATLGGSSLAITLDGSGTLRPIAVAAGVDLDAYVMPAGTQIKTSGGGYIVATLEPVGWVADAFAAQTVRCRQVSGTPAALNLVATFVDTLGDTSVVVTTTATTVPDDIDAAEIVLRYTAAFAACVDNDIGASIDVMFSDRNEAAINDALATHVDTAVGAGVFRIGVIAPPVGTSLATARGTSGDGNGRTSLVQDYVVDLHPGVRRKFPKDSDNLIAPDYLATFPGQGLLAAVICEYRPEQNPAEETTKAIKRYGVVGIESVGTGGQPHWAAGLVTPKLVKKASGSAVFFRDGIMASGVEIATERTRQFLLSGIFERVQPFQKTVASASNREACADGVRAFLQGLLDTERIAAFALSDAYDSTNRHLTLGVAVQEVGTLNVITIYLSVGADSIGVLGGGEQEAA